MEEEIKNNLKKGTTTVGVVCKDGIVLAADKRASAGMFIASREVDKIHKITDNMAVTMAGMVSDAQLLLKLIKAELRLKKIRTSKEVTVNETANLLAGIIYQNIRKMSMVPGITAFLLGGHDKKGFGLYELGVDGSITKESKFVSNGSGSPLAYGVLEAQYVKDMTMDNAIKLAVKAISSAIKRDMPTGEGIDVITITDKGAKRVLAKKISYELK
jgi:proteasome beta subunit